MVSEWESWSAAAMPTRHCCVKAWRPKGPRTDRGLAQQRVVLGQLMRVPGGEPVADGLLGDLVFGHRLDLLVVHQQPVHVQRLLARRVCRLKDDGAALLGV